MSDVKNRPQKPEITVHNRPTIVRAADAFSIVINGLEISGWLIDETCPRCAAKLVFDDDNDAEFCATCNQWAADSAFSDPDCDYCRNRPEPPLNRS